MAVNQEILAVTTGQGNVFILDKINGKIVKSGLDFDSNEEMNKIINEFKPDIIGISVMIFYKNFVHRAIKSIREKGIKTPIFLGGPYSTGDYENVLKDPNIDFCILGEGEVTIAELVKHMMKNDNKLPSQNTLKTIAGMAFNNKFSLEEM